MYAVLRDVGEHVLKTKAGQDFSVLACPPVVELPGIEPATEIALSCGNAEAGYAKRRESTRNVALRPSLQLPAHCRMCAAPPMYQV